MDLTPLVQAFSRISGPLSLSAFFVLIFAAVFYWTTRKKPGFDLLQRRFGLDRSRYFGGISLLFILLFVLAIFALILSAELESTERFVFLGASLIIFFFGLTFAYLVGTKLLQPKKLGFNEETSLTGNVYWEDNGRAGAPIVGAELRVNGVNGEWRTSGGGYFKISFPVSASSGKRHIIRVTVPTAEKAIHKSVSTVKTKGIEIKMAGHHVDSAQCESLKDRQRSIRLRLQALERKRDRLGPDFKATEEAELLRAREDLREIEAHLRAAGC